MPVTKETLDEIALSRAEYNLIVDRLDREPNPVELGMFGALWSEHCGYKHSKPLLRLLPSRSPNVVSNPGAENAGVVDLGDGLAAVFKVESHNHPSAVEPLQGAATGVGGIVRDILAMGARPVALLNSLRFGSAGDTQTRRLLQGVVEGISWYGNCIGVPDVAGEIYFDPCYSGNPLVNAMCVGLVPIDRIATSAASHVGDVLLLAGSGTGRDGIHGASGLASRTFDQEQELRPTVQVGNPFLEKLLIEACLEALATGGVSAIQDLGAAGLTSAAVESAASGGRGVALDISMVHRREKDMTGYDVMLSESQERMLLVVPPRNVARVQRVMDKWDVECHQIGQVIGLREVEVSDGVGGARKIAHLPIQHLVEAPRYRLRGKPSPAYFQRQRLDLGRVPLPGATPRQVLLDLLASPNIASKGSVHRQYDNQVQTNTVAGPGSDAAVLRIKNSTSGGQTPGDTEKGIALTIDGNSRYCYLDPYRGGQIVVAEACRNLSCVGAEPLALTDCLNFGNPENPEVYYQLEWCVRGMAKACRVLNVPVVSGNVSLYNEAQGQAIFPTPVVGGLGLLQDVRAHCGSGFQGQGSLDQGMAVILLGADRLGARASDLAGSEFLRLFHGTLAGRPHIDLGLEKQVQELCRRLIGRGIIASAHDCSEGGLAPALAECCIQGNVGFCSGLRIPRRWDVALFGERQSRIVVSLPQEGVETLERLASESRTPVLRLGTTGGSGFRFGSALDVPVQDLSEAWNTGLDRALGG
jgi:phosphoribosylformylglycinamidine synthase II